MKRAQAGLLVCAFVVGVMIAPTVHMVHCATTHMSHNAAQCPICQLSKTPMVMAVSGIGPTVQSLLGCPVCLPHMLFRCATLSGPAQARAPPVC